MNIWKYAFSQSYRKHRWASKNLAKYRAMHGWLFSRKVRRVLSMPLVMAGLVERKFALPSSNMISWDAIRLVQARSITETEWQH